MQYSIWIVDSWPNAKGHTRCFEEVALALQAAFRQLGYDVPVVDSPDKARGRVIVLGAGVLHRHKNITLPNDMVIYNFEQVHEKARFFLPDNPYIHYLRRYPVWDYSRNNIEELASRGVTDVVMCGVGYVPELTRIPNAETQDIDVLFIGSMHERRQKIVDELKQRGLRVHVIQDMYGPSRDAFIARSKVILNIHLQPANVFEVVRVSYMLANRKCVVSESGDDAALEAPYQDAVVFRPYHELVSACLEYVSDERKRRRQEEAGFSMFSQVSQVKMLEAALAADQGNGQEGKKPAQAQPAQRSTDGDALAQRTIFVNIASYRDPEIDATLQSLFKAAKYPARIRVGVCLQIDEQKDALCTINTDRPWQVNVRQCSARESQGANWARAQAQKLYNDEDYVLQIDSHMRFADGWDVSLTGMLESCPSDRPVLSTYVPRYTPPDNRYTPTDLLLRIRVFGFGRPQEPQLLHLTKVPVPLADKERTGLYPCPFYIANFMFCRAQTLKDVPFDPHIRFWGDEITYSARLWTHGYDVFQPDRLVIWHYWRRDELVKIQPYRSTQTQESRQSLARIKHLLGFERSDDTIALTDLEQYGLGGERELDDLWAFAGIDWQNRVITKTAKEGRWDMAARDKAKKKTTAKTAKKTTPKKTEAVKTEAVSGAPKAASPKKAAGKSSAKARAVQPAAQVALQNPPVAKKLPKIFVQIPSYRDPDCQYTVKDLFEKAAHPERISVGICWQFVKGEDDDCFKVPYPYPDRVRVHEMDASLSRGVCSARSITQQLWVDEEFTLHIDSHMRFVENWDDELIAMWEQCNMPGAVLSTYPPAFVPPDTLHHAVLGIVADKFDHDQIFLMKSTHLPMEDGVIPKPAPAAFIGACMLFAPSSIIKHVPYDPHLYFFGEEITYAARLWTHGYDLFHPNKAVIYHDWDRNKRKTHFTDHPNWPELNALSFKRVRYIMGTEGTDDQAALVDISKYSLGVARSLEQYCRFSGVDFRTKTISDNARFGIFKPGIEIAPRGATEPPPPPTSIRMSDGKLPRIYVQIPSYRDPDCQHTVKDLFEKAAHPERIFVGICWQYIEELDQDCFEVPYPYPDQVRVHKADARGCGGMCWARNITQQMWQGEEYTLSMDSHMRFEKGWDDILLNMLHSCDNPEKSVLTAHPPQFEQPGLFYRQCVHGMYAHEFTEREGILQIRGGPPFNIEIAPDKPMVAAFFGDGLFFASSKVIKDVPFDPQLFFFGQEISMAVRLWTHGYDLFHPNRLCVYHDYTRPNRKFHSNDNTDWYDRDKKSFARVRHLLGTEKSTDPEVLIDLDKYGLGTERTLAEYQEFSGIDFAAKTISEFARKYEFKPYAKKGTTDNGAGGGAVAHNPQAPNAYEGLPLHKRPFAITRPGAIFINIASYRDPECQHTVKDLFEKANNPDRIFVGICWQFDEKEDAHCFEVVTRPEQVRIFPVDWRDAEGVCWARFQTQQLWDGEEYNLMIDSHMRFVPGWDDLMIKELAACDAPKPFLSCSPAAYTPPDKLSRSMNPSIRRVKPFLPDGNMRCQGEALDRRPEHPLNGAFMVANFAFSRSEVLKEVPYDPYLYFDQEEITYAARLYTHGWDIFSARQQFLYHYYNDVKAPGGSVRKLHWRDLHKENQIRIRFLRDRGLKRFNHMTGHTPSTDPEVIRELDEYGWGAVRSFQQFEDYAGIDFKNKIVHEKALRCWFIRDLAKYRDRPIYIPELDDQQRIAAQGGGHQAIARAAGNMQQTNLYAVPAGQFHPGVQQSKPIMTLVSLQDKAEAKKPEDAPKPVQQTTQPPQPTPQPPQPTQPPVVQANAAQQIAKQASVVPVAFDKQVPEIVKDAPLQMLEMGDFMPMFDLMDHNNRPVNIERFGGKHILIFFLPADDMQYLDHFFRAIQQELGKLNIPNMWQLYVLDADPSRLAEIRNRLNIPHTLFSSDNRRVPVALGLCQSGDDKLKPVGYVLNTNMKIISRHQEAAARVMAASSVASLNAAISEFRQRYAQPLVISEMAPALIVPNAFTPEFCQRCLDSFHNGHTFEGTVGGGQSKAYRPEAKRRIDHIPPAALVAEIDDKLSRSLFPEIKKVFGFDVRYRELYKVGLYTGENKGFFTPHRDNFDSPLGYRRIAMTLHLTDDFEGGGLRFPEYGNTVYRPALGSAIAFSCSTTHEALPVTNGKRFVLVGFFHGEEDERFRRYFAVKKGNPINPRDFVPTLRSYPGLRLERNFYKVWKDEYVNYDRASMQAPASQAKGAEGKPAAYGSVQVQENHGRTEGQPDFNKSRITTVAGHQASKVFECKGGLVMDDFLPEDAYNALLHYCQRLDYDRINTNRINRAWHVHDGFPLRSTLNAYYYADKKTRHAGGTTYPSGSPLDAFMEHLAGVQPQTQHLTGVSGAEGWGHFSVTSWLYPHGTSLALHEDGAGSYTGAYVYFLNPHWRPHWGGQLFLMDDRANDKMRNYQSDNDASDIYKGGWMHVNQTDEIMMQEGLAHCIFPKRNRIVFIAKDTFHMVTRVNEQSGDNIRISLAGFFVKQK